MLQGLHADTWTALPGLQTASARRSPRLATLLPRCQGIFPICKLLLLGSEALVVSILGLIHAIEKAHGIPSIGRPVVVCGAGVIRRGQR